MLKPHSNAIFQCRMVSCGTTWSASILCGVILLMFLLVLFLSGVDAVTVFIAFSPAIVFVLTIGVAYSIEMATIFIITTDMVILSRFNRIITQLPRNEISSAGVFVRYNNKGIYLYVSTEIICNPSLESKSAKSSDPRFKLLKSTANKKGARSICIEQSKGRIEALQRLIPEFNLNNVIRF